VAFVSGGSGADPQTPPGLPGMPPPFLSIAVVGSGGLTAAIDAYGDVVDLRAPGPAGRGLIDNPADRQAAGSVAADTGIVPQVSVGGGPAQALWRADSVTQRYLPGTNVVRTVARFGRVTVSISDAAVGGTLGLIARASGPPGVRIALALGIDPETSRDARCAQGRRPRQVALVCSADASTAATPAAPDSGSAVMTKAAEIGGAAATGDRRWVGRAGPLGSAAPNWARRLYERSLLVLRALTDARTGAVAAGARDGWGYVWPRDAGTAALAFAAAGYGHQAHRVARFLLGLDLGAAARFDGGGTPIPGRDAQGDAAGWVAVAARSAGLPAPAANSPWRNRADYQEGAPGTYLANSIASSARASLAALEARQGLLRRAGEPGSGLDSAAAWAVRPFPQPALFPAVRRTLLRLTGDRTRFGIVPSESWAGVDPWTAPTAWSAWSLAALADREERTGASRASARRERRRALRLLDDLRRAATPAGALPERVDARTGIARSTTPLAWSHAFAILALRQLWPGRVTAASEP
jgi:hypothetical protein